MSRLALYLTLPGGGGGAPKPPKPPPPPAAPPPVPTMQDAAAAAARREMRGMGRTRQGVGGSVRNLGGAGGLGLADTQRALKALTGQ